MSWVRVPPGAPKGINMENYKSFREQILECRENGNQIEVDVSKYNFFGTKKMVFPTKILVCVKYQCVCSSKVCAGERIGETDEYPGDVGC